MSAYGHQMEREHSSPLTRSISSLGGSDMGSRYESGFYITSFAATIFIGALITIGVLLATLLVALTVMLQACETRSSGVVELPTAEDYSRCNMLALHMELNNFEASELPPMCNDLAIRYVKQGQYGRDLVSTLGIAEHYFSSIKPHSSDLVLIDAEDILPSDSDCIRFHRKCPEETYHEKHKLMSRLYIKLQTEGWSITLLSRRSEKDKNATTEQLTSAGYKDWFSLIMRSGDEMQMDNQEYFSRRRAALQKEGLHIRVLISSKMDAITGVYLVAKQIFKLPNPIFYTSEDYIKRTYSTAMILDLEGM